MREFDFDGGHLALDFANTAEWHASEQPEERLESYADLLTWSVQSGTLDVDQARKLQEQAAASPIAAEQTLTRALALREAIYRTFSTLAEGGQPAEADLALLAQELSDTIDHGRLEPADGGFSWTWLADSDPARPLWPITRTALDLLRSEKIERVGQCADDRGCGYLFLDTSRNHSRRWCSMDSCGNRAKARSYYERARADS